METFLWLYRVTTLDDEDIHTLYRQDVDGSSSSRVELTLDDKRARLVEHIAGYQREVGRDGGHVSIGWMTWTHKGVADASADEVVLDVAGCQ